MALIDITYFVREINIPNTSSAAVNSLLVSFINKYEPEFFDKVLGYPLSENFVNGIAAPIPEQKWKDIRDGAVYTYNNKPRKWRGLLVTTPDKQSPIANYIYYYFMRNSHTKTTTGGEQKMKVENSDQSTPAWKSNLAWLQMKEWVEQLYCFLEANKTVYDPPKTRYEVIYELGSVNEFSI